ncbi:MAG: 16S rRNA (cytosine(1402)-N(4))-methyltransferase RsmH [Myxococcota bacterium]
MSTFHHIPVLLNEVLAALAPASGRVYVDGTVGGAGHAEAILEASAPKGRLLGSDRDEHALRAARERLAKFGDRASVVHGELSELRRTMEDAGVARADGILADLGVSSPQLDDPARGFSLQREGPLDMRMDQTRGRTARELINALDDTALADILYHYGEERRSRPIARSICRARDEGALETTADLRRAVIRVTGPKRGRADPATRTFQALRIAVNRELDQLEALLRDGPDLLQDEGVLAVISFHSLEDRMVKHAFRSDERVVALTKKPVRGSDEECAENPRARSAKLRAARRRPREETP